MFKIYPIISLLVCISNLKHNQVKKHMMNRHSKPEFCVLIILSWNYLITMVFSSNFTVFWMHNFCCQQQFSIMGIVSIISTWYICDHIFYEGSTPSPRKIKPPFMEVFPSLQKNTKLPDLRSFTSVFPKTFKLVASQRKRGTFKPLYAFLKYLVTEFKETL